MVFDSCHAFPYVYIPVQMEDIQALVDHDLGYSVSPGQAKRVFTVFLCVAKRKIMGCVFTERIKQVLNLYKV